MERAFNSIGKGLQGEQDMPTGTAKFHSNFSRLMHFEHYAARLAITAVLVNAIISFVMTPIGVHAFEWIDLVQPPGEVVAVYDPNDINEVMADRGYTNPPFDTGTEVTEIITAESLYFVRVFAPPSTAAGSWIMRASTIRGLTAEQIKDIFALPTTPTRITYVVVPAGAHIYTGVAGPIEGWGNGGAQQSFLIERISMGSFMHEQELGPYALLYAPAVGSIGNTGSVAVYLDGLSPTPYSDLEDVYAALDFLNYGDLTPLREALDHIGPERYDALTQVGIRNSLLFGKITGHRSRTNRAELLAYGTTAKNASDKIPVAYAQFAGVEDSKSGRMVDASNERRERAGEDKTNVWSLGVGEFGSRSSWADHTGFDFQTGGVVLGVDILRRKSLTLGGAVGYLRTSLDWDNRGGGSDIDNPRLGIYCNYLNSAGFFVDALLAGGYDSISTDRNIDFYSVSRTAHSDASGYDMIAQIRGGYDFTTAKWIISPFAELSYIYLYYDDFDESGADSLNLNVRSRDAQTFRSQLGVRMERSFTSGGRMELTPTLEVAWAHDIPLDNRAISASLINQAGSFDVNGLEGDTDSLVVDAGLSAQLTTSLMLFAGYGTEITDNFNIHRVGLGVKYRF
jgi:outer membrane autotransporter protein